MGMPYTSNEVKETKISNGIQEVVFIPMHHVGTPEFYHDVEKRVDSLQSMNFLLLLEGVGTDIQDSVQLDSVIRKFRKIVGINPMAPGGYLGLGGQGLFGKNSNFINQPSYEDLRVDMSKAKVIDVPLETLVAEYERDFGQVALGPCDFRTHLDSLYPCRSESLKKKVKFVNTYLMGMRNHKVAQTILEAQSKRIAVIYGEAHIKGIIKELVVSREFCFEWIYIKLITQILQNA